GTNAESRCSLGPAEQTKQNRPLEAIGRLHPVFNRLTGVTVEHEREMLRNVLRGRLFIEPIEQINVALMRAQPLFADAVQASIRTPYRNDSSADRNWHPGQARVQAQRRPRKPRR